MNFTWIGNAVYMSMDIPDTFLAVCCTFSPCSHRCALDFSLPAFKIVKLYSLGHRKGLRFCGIFWSMDVRSLRSSSSSKYENIAGTSATFSTSKSFGP